MLWLNIVSGILAIGVTFVTYYLTIKNKIVKAAQGAIVDAEELDAIGEEKMKVAVEQVYAVIPAVAKPFFTKPTLEIIIQAIFDEMEEYALKQNKK